MPELTDVQWIFVVLFALYAAESLTWVRPRVAALTISGNRAGAVVSQPLIGNESGGFHFGGWSPSHATVLAEPLPISLSADGVVAFVAAAPMCRDRPYQSGQAFDWAALTAAAADERTVRANGQMIATVSSSARASFIAEQLRQISAATPDDRTSRIETWRANLFDSSMVEDRIEQWRRHTRWVRRGAWLLLLWIFGIGGLMYFDALPVAVDATLVYQYLALGCLLWWITAAAVFVAHKRLYPDRRLARFKTVVLNLVSPAVPLRAANMLGRDLFDLIDPLTVASVLLPRDAYEQTAAAVHRDFQFPILPDAPEESRHQARKILVADREARRPYLSERMSGLPNDPWTRDGHHLDANSYCPRCLQGFTIAEATCDGCGGRATVPVSAR